MQVIHVLGSGFPLRVCAQVGDGDVNLSLSPTTMILSVLAPLLLLPFASAGVHKLKLHKLPQTLQNPSLEAAYLSEKYGGRQVPMLGAGGLGRPMRVARPSYNEEGEDLLWTQDAVAQGGHGVPLTSQCSHLNLCDTAINNQQTL